MWGYYSSRVYPFDSGILSPHRTHGLMTSQRVARLSPTGRASRSRHDRPTWVKLHGGPGLVGLQVLVPPSPILCSIPNRLSDSWAARRARRQARQPHPLRVGLGWRKPAGCARSFGRRRKAIVAGDSEEDNDRSSGTPKSPDNILQPPAQPWLGRHRRVSFFPACEECHT